MAILSSAVSQGDEATHTQYNNLRTDAITHVHDGVDTPAIRPSVASITSSRALTTSEQIALVDATSGAVTVTLPTAVGVSGRPYTVKKVDSSSNAVTVGTTSSQQFKPDDTTTFSLSLQGEVLDVYSDNANWQVV